MDACSDIHPETEEKDFSEFKDKNKAAKVQYPTPELTPGRKYTFKDLIRGELNFIDYNFNSAAVEIVPSIAGIISGKEKLGYGQYRFGELVNKHLPEQKPDKDSVISYQSTSYGSLSKQYLQKFVRTLSGDTHDLINDDEECASLQLIYPTQEYVDGVMATTGKNITCLKMNEKKWYKNQDFPREYFYKFQTKPEVQQEFGDFAHHTKAMMIMDGQGEVQAVYVGSHNMSPGAWGTWVQESDEFKMTNFEIGVLFTGNRETLNRV
eukprot:CAMPEP_0168323082 /NCGR_PEP_ID=MMETSP0213-20121227/3280_1 /TAXON_ID=151035 /ORGANISM="Euplotes harpa, Strain FSP1.4" /LENGTH=264 /DNA_ID=CAMNT_0008325107 /DNA_START=525 /DNA_END=1319 /DNA_ORIENTATION=-